MLAVVAALAIASAACDDPTPKGSPLCRRGSPRITVFQGPEGTCIPRSRLVGYRCENADPLIVFDAGSGAERRFLGGVFTVVVPRLPEGSEVIGVGDGAQLVIVDGDDRRLYTVRGSSIWRWLALPPASQLAADPARVFMLGDSLLDGGAPALISALPEWSIEIDALPGRGSVTGATIAEARAANDHVVVVELGTNDRNVGAFAENAERIVSAFRGVPLVLWQNVEAPPDIVDAEEINDAIEKLAGLRPNVAIANWDAGVPEEILFDGVHPDTAHQDAMATLIAPMLQRWRVAATQQPSC